MADEGFEPLVKRLFSQREYSDCTIICGDDKYHLHKAIICPQSRFFAAAFKHNTKASLSNRGISNQTDFGGFGKEQETSTVELQEDDPEAVRCMLYFLYHMDYTPNYTPNYTTKEPPKTSKQVENEHVVTQWQKKNGYCMDWGAYCSIGQPCVPRLEPLSNLSAPEKPTHLDHVLVYATADKYGIEPLKRLAASKFLAVATQLWNHPRLFDAINHIYLEMLLERSCALKDAVLDVIMSHKSLLEVEDIKEVMEQSSLAFELLTRFRIDGRLN